MTTFSVVISCDDSCAEALEIDCASPTAAIVEARSFLALAVENSSGGIAEATATVGEGGLFEDAVQWLGAWEWSGRTGWEWRPRMTTA